MARSQYLRATALLCLALLGANRPAQAETAIGAQDFLDRFFGVNLHLDNCCNGRYADTDQVIGELKYIGASRLRDWANAHPGSFEKWQQVYRATGAPFHASIPVASPDHQRIALDVIKDWLQRDPKMIAVIEGGNEEDLTFAKNMGATLDDTAELQHEVYKVGRTAGTKVAQMSVGAGWKAPFYEGNYKNFGKPPADLGNAHVYMMPGQWPSMALGRVGKLAAWSVDDKPVDVTEFGTYRTPGLDEDLIAGYMHLAPFASYLQGQAGLSVYALHDDGSNALGFYNVKGAARPHADYWHATTRLLADPKGRNLPPRDVPVTLTDIKTAGKGTLGVKHVSLLKADGALWVAVFDEEKADADDGAATVDLGAAYPSVQVFDARTGAVIDRATDTQRVTLTLPPNHVFLVRAAAKPLHVKKDDRKAD